MKKLNEYFDEIFVLTIPRRYDRWFELNKKLVQKGIFVKTFEGYDKESFYIKSIYKKFLKLHNKWKWSDGNFAILCSYIKLYQHILDINKVKPLSKILILEDDILFHKNFDYLFDESIKNIPENWDIWYLGGIYWNENKNERSTKINDYFSIPLNVTGNFAIAIDIKMIPDILNTLKIALNEGIYTTDQKINRIYQKNDKYNVYISNTMLFIHNYGFSDTENKNFSEYDWGSEKKIGRYIENIDEYNNIGKTTTEYINHDKMISIVVTAYKSEDFIEECLDSIESQTFFKENNNYEILLGIDGCEKTLQKVKKIKNKYRNLKIFMMNDNKGTYITTNTLLSISKGYYIIRFDSDDIMYPHMIEELVKNIKDFDLVRFKFINDNNKKTSTYFSYGQIFFKRYILDKLGAYSPWICSADSDFLVRFENTNFKLLFLNLPLHIRRYHKNQLSTLKNTNISSPLRLQYKKLTKENKKNGLVYVEPVTNIYTEIN